MGSDDDMSVTTVASDVSMFSRPGSPEKLGGQISRLAIVIEDSDWDDEAEVLN